jgi:hypothetical protein
MVIGIKRVKDTSPNWLLINGSSISLKWGERCLTPLSTIFQLYSGGPNNDGKTIIRWLNTSEFFKCLWIDMGKCVLRSINYGYEKE